METQTLITKINGVEIVTVDKDGETYVPIKPICDALGIDAKSQRAKLQEDEFFASTGVIITSVAADEKEREMYCMRLRDVYGWLATINPGKVAPEAREAVIRYRRECYDVLYEHFFAKTQRQAETNKAERDELERLRQLYCQEKEIKSQINESKKRIDDIRSSRLDEQPTLF